MPASSCIPWRSVWLPRALTAVALVVGLPMFLRSSPWCDVTLYQLAARNILHGGTHYKDLFDTNMPGPVWVVTCVQMLFGTNVVALRAVDLCFVLGIVVLLNRLAKWGGATPAARWWMIAAMALFYPFASEMAQAQRDLWMALPALGAVALRVRRGTCAVAPGHRPFWRSFVEGVVWGIAVWVKPHIVLMALAVWLLTARRLAYDSLRPKRAMAIDLFGNLAGGIVAAVPGIIWLIEFNAWGPFMDVFLGWNPYYTLLAERELPFRVHEQLHWFPPWSLGLIPTVPLALLSVIDMAPWRGRDRAGGLVPPTKPEGTDLGPVGRRLSARWWDVGASADARFVRGVLGGLYLVWVTQAFLIQRGFLYVHVPETFLMFAVWATHRWAWPFVVLVWLVLTSSLWLVADHSAGTKAALDRLSEETRERYLPRHPITNPTRLKLWPQCLRTDLTDRERYKLWDDLRLHPPHEAAISWSEIEEVAEYLRSQGVKDGEVIGWHNSPHAVYLVMDIKPGFKFIHVYTAISIAYGDDAPEMIGRGGVFQELVKARKARYVISDLEWAAAVGEGHSRAAVLGPARDGQHLLPIISPCAGEFPYNQPTRFRSRKGTGRYVVHEIVTRKDDEGVKPH
jgi:hypothetical protein